jgi:hypothetical protein
MLLAVDLVSLVAGVVLGALPAWGTSRLRASSSRAEIKDLRERLATLEVCRTTDVQAARNELSVVAYPYQEERGDDGYVIDDREAEVGYKFQLFIRGIPCFDAHRVVVSKFSKSEVSTKKIKEAASDVMELLQTWAAKHPAISVIDKLVVLPQHGAEKAPEKSAT